MQNQVKTIDVDAINMSGKKGVCTEYVMYHKLRRKYIVPIEEDINNISKEMSKRKHFSENYYNNKAKILALFSYIKSSFDLYDIKKLLSKDVSNLEFISNAYEIRIRNYQGVDEGLWDKP